MFSHLSATPALLLLLLLLTLLTTSPSSALRPLSRRNASCPKCFPGKVCVGPRGNRKCVTPMEKGQVCGKDPFWVCKPGLVCERFVCRGKYVPKGGRCTRKGLPCFPGYVCAGTPKIKKCVKPMREGKPCANDPWWVCAAGLVCRRGVCQKDRIPKDGSCRFPGAKCAPGLVCAGPPDNKRCVMPMKEGGQCRGGRDPYWVCIEGLVCINNTCQKPRVPKGGSCKDKGDVCMDGLICAGTTENPRCVMPMGKGGRCGGNDPYWVCKTGLTCVNERCV